MSASRLPFLLAIGLATLASGCVWAPGQHLRSSAPHITDDNIEIIPITGRLIAQDNAARTVSTLPPALLEYRPDPYTIGAGDLLYITVWDHPELTVPAGPQQQLSAAGRPVQSDGTLFYPYIGNIQAAGLTPQALRQAITTRLARYIEAPQVDISVLTYASQRVWITGASAQSAVVPITVVPLTLPDAISEAGLNPVEADTSGVRLTRDGVTYTIDLTQALDSPIYLRDADQIFVPYLEEKEVFVVGEVNQPGALSFRSGTMTLNQALGRVRGVNQNSANGDAIYVIRGAHDLTQVPAAIYQLEAKSPSAYAIGGHFELLPGDVVFVGAAGISRWNRFISQLLPFAGILSNVASANQDL